MNSDRNKLYTKLITFDEVYNFVVQTFFISNQLRAQIIDIPSRSIPKTEIWTLYQLFESQGDLN
jgi:hypothetical protein